MDIKNILHKHLAGFEKMEEGKNLLHKNDVNLIRGGEINVCTKVIYSI